MPTYAPGPSAVRAPFPILPRVMSGTPFSDAGVPLIGALQVGELLVGDRLRTIGSIDPDDLAGDYHADVTPALEALGVLLSPAADPELVASVGVLEETIANLEDLTTTLPDPFDEGEDIGIPELPGPPGQDRD